MTVMVSEAFISPMHEYRIDSPSSSWSPEQILAHPLFPKVRRDHIRNFTRILGSDRRLTKLMMDSGRLVTASVIVALHAAMDEREPTTWPTLARLKGIIGDSTLASERNVTLMVARLRDTGYVVSEPAEGDARMKLLRPTSLLMEHDRAFLAALIGPLGRLHPDGRYRPLIEEDPDFHLAFRRNWARMARTTAAVLAASQPMAMFYSRHCGYLALLIVAQQAFSGDGGQGPGFSLIARRLGVSRTHIRDLFADAVALGLVELGPKGGREVSLTPKMMAAFDQFLASTAAGYDRLMAQTHDTYMQSPSKQPSVPEHGPRLTEGA